MLSKFSQLEIIVNACAFKLIEVTFKCNTTFRVCYFLKNNISRKNIPHLKSYQNEKITLAN
jgi:hypothetical protein